MRFFVFLLTGVLTHSELAVAQSSPSERVFLQTPEVQPSMTSDNSESKPPEKSLTLDLLDDGPRPRWIWGPDNNQNYRLSTTFPSAAGSKALLVASCDNVGTILLNGKQVAMSNEWQEPMAADVSSHLVDGTNTVTAKVANQGGIAAFVLKLVIQNGDGDLSYVVSDTNWQAKQEDGNDARVELRGTYGEGPWGPVFSSAATNGRVPRGTFLLQPGFRVEKLFTVPKDQLGSWVCIAFDDKGRLIASDQGGKGICRITLPPVVPENSDKTTSETVKQTVVEHLDFSGCQFQPSGAQGILYAFGSLYFCCNGGPGSGLYRARDTDGDDQFDECVKLKAFRGGGEHGPHSLRLSPDGKRIFVIAGNHTDPPFQPGEEVDNENYSSRVPTNWGEDHLLPRMWDANGHARGKLAPGGWIASTDADGKTWDIWSIGFRNPYDMAFNADGELFAYDADMEWDVGLPWYRPTRVVHASSGSEFGWRSGSGKWPDYYIDSLPAMVNIGPGSPVGVDFGYGAPLAADSVAAKNAAATVPTSLDGYVYAPLKFPAKYQKALYICDWTFGTMYAIHTEPHQSTYKATKEEFLSRSPLPLTDCAAGPDGAMYFTIGGRGTQSELYRVVYEGDEKTIPTVLTNSILADARSSRRATERLHGFPDAMSDATRDAFAILVDPQITESSDRFQRTATRNAFFSSGFFNAIASMDALRQLQSATESGDSGYDNAIMAFLLAKTPTNLLSDKTDVDKWKQLAARVAYRLYGHLNFSPLTHAQKKDVLRGLAVIASRLGGPNEIERQRLLEIFEPYYLSGVEDIDRELCQVLVYLKSDQVVGLTILQMLENVDRTGASSELSDLITRNGGYGRAIKASLQNPPDKQQIWYAYCLRCADVGWTPELRAEFYRWFGRAKQWSGGNSYRKYLQNMEDEAWAKTPFDDRVLIEAAGARTPYQPPELPKPIGPGKDWTLDEVRALAKTGLKNRNFENGQRAFAATRCIVCHRFGGDGGATGPDLTQLAGRFDLNALTEAIMDPSKVISDQYKASIVITESGQSYTGRIVSENDDQISVLTDPEDSTKIVDIQRSEIEEIAPGKSSIMPAGLLKTLNQDEVLDLLAYLLSRGNEKNPMFTQD